jgi:hypothetical protein
MTSQKDELAKVKARIRALSEKTTSQGCSEHEAMIAADMVGRLLSQYNLTMDEVSIREEKCVHVKVPLGLKRWHSGLNFIQAVANFCDLRYWRTGCYRGSLGIYINFYGLEPDVQMGKYLVEMILSAQAAEHRSFRRTEIYHQAANGRRATSSFKNGFATRIHTRMNTLKRERDAELRVREEQLKAERAASPGAPHSPSPAASTGTSLIVLKGQVVTHEFEAFKKQSGLRLVSTYSKARVSNGGSYNAGSEAGGRVNLNRPLGGGSSVTGYLT